MQIQDTLADSFTAPDKDWALCGGRHASTYLDKRTFNLLFKGYHTGPVRSGTLIGDTPPSRYDIRFRRGGNMLSTP